MSKRVLFLVGLPASGKSTFRQQMIDRLNQNDILDEVLGSYADQYVFISSDDEILKIAAEEGLTYDQVFQRSELVDRAMYFADVAFEDAIEHGKYVVIDRTNMSSKSRAKYVQTAKNYGYTCDAVVFARPMTDAAHNEWNKRLNRPGKTIPVNVLQDMFRNYERPTLQEGFTNVIDIDTFERFN